MKFNTIYLVICTWGGLYALPGAAQHDHQLLLGVGIAPSSYFETTGFWEEPVEGAASTYGSLSGVYHLGYLRGAGRHTFGILLAGERQKVTTSGISPVGWSLRKEVQDRYLTMLTGYRFAWGLRRAGKWYSGFSPGISWQQRREAHNDFSNVKDEFDKVRFAYQVTAAGFEFGKKFGGYVEAGYGYKGFLSAGVKYGF